MRTVAFVRNLNQGQRGHATTADLVAAFVDAGCHEVSSFQSNGTVVFDADDPALAAEAMEALAARTGVAREVFTLSLDELARVVDAVRGAADADRHEVTLHRGGTVDPADPDVQRRASRRRCTIVDAAEGWVVTRNERDRESNATPTIEDVTGTPATSRGVPTLVRLLARHASSA